MRVAIEFYSGTQSFTKVAKRLGYDTISIDILPRTKPTICADLLTFDYTKLPVPAVIWLSPPCTEYSIAKHVGTRDLVGADKHVKRSLEIVEYFKTKNPKLIWFMENAGTGLLRRAGLATWGGHGPALLLCAPASPPPR